MSLFLLTHLNGANQGPFRRWIDSRPASPRIAWYPSAGADLRDLLYLHPRFREVSPSSQEEPKAPDLFLHTDYCLAEAPDFFDRVTLHEDTRTKIRLVRREELRRCELPVAPDLVSFGINPAITHRVLFMQLELTSHRLGRSFVPLLYVCAENAAFCAQRLRRFHARISHVVQVRYGHALGGGLASPGWLLSQVDPLGVEVMVSDGSEQRDASSTCPTFRRYPCLRGAAADTSRWPRLRCLHRDAWDGYDAVTWWRLQTETPRALKESSLSVTELGHALS